MVGVAFVVLLALHCPCIGSGLQGSCRLGIQQHSDGSDDTPQVGIISYLSYRDLAHKLGWLVNRRISRKIGVVCALAERQVQAEHVLVSSAVARLGPADS